MVKLKLCFPQICFCFGFFLNFVTSIESKLFINAADYLEKTRLNIYFTTLSFLC